MAEGDPSLSGIIVTPSYVPVQRSVSRRHARNAAKAYGEVEVWLDGEVVACGCPDCGAPMSVRMWLKLADCFRCAIGIELTEEIIDEIERLGKEVERRTASEIAAPTAAPASSSAAGPAATSSGASPAAIPATAPAGTPPPPPDSIRRSAQPRREHDGRVAAAQPGRVRKKIHSMATAGSAAVLWREILGDLPAWVISGVLHLALLLILAMLAFAVREEPEPFITLSTHVDPVKREGGEIVSKPVDELESDLPVNPNDLPPNKDARIKLNQDARELRLDKETIVPNAPSYEEVLAAVQSSDENRRAVAVRDPRVRAEMVRQEGGTLLTEAAVARGLRWMARHQNANGSWSLHAFSRAGDCKCGGHGNIRSDVAGTALALLPYLGAGQTHLIGNYQNQVSGGLRYLLSIQKDDGDLRGESSGNSGMYAHGQATLVLSEAYKMTGDQKLREPAQKAIDFIVDAQHVGGGWRYKPHYERGAQAPDTSVLGWQVLALHSAKQAYLEVPETALQLAALYLDKAQVTTSVQRGGRKRQYGQRGGLYAYMPRQSYKPSMTAEALLCRIMMGWDLNNPGLQEGIGFLVDHELPNTNDKDLYFWYYGTQMMHHIGGDPWQRWNVRMRDILVRFQEKDGHEAGSWPPSIDSGHGSQGGRLYTTAFATAILEVYYRHAPLFRQIDLR